jgi:ubiquinol-cytochrome c reductase iron-sulfur subunit
MTASIDRRAFAALSAAAWVAADTTKAAESAYPVVAYWNDPIDVGAVAPGDWRIALVDGDPVILRRRTPTQIAQARATAMADLLDPAADETRAPGGEWLVVSGLCTHASCPVQPGLGRYGGFQCFCHGSAYDLSGRVRQGPAKRNLPVVPHALRGASMVLIRP